MAAERPRVLFLGPDVPGGMSSAMRALLDSPLGERYELELIATHTGTFGPLRRLAVFGGALARLAWWSLRGRGRIVHVHGTKRGSMFRKAICVFLAKGLRRKVVLQLHSGPGDIASFRAGLPAAAVAFLRASFRAADVVVAVSQPSAAALGTAFGFERIVVVPNAAPSPPGAVADLTAGDDPLVVYLGGFANPVKGGEVLLAALAGPELAATRFALAGPGELPDAGRALLADRPAAAWEGWLEPERKHELMGAAEVFVLPSTSEGLPMALLEAMTYGLAIVSTDVGGVPEVAEDGVEALIVPAGEADRLAAALTAVTADPQLRERLGRAARERAREFAPERIADRFDAIYRQLLGAAGDGPR